LIILARRLVVGTEKKDALQKKSWLRGNVILPIWDISVVYSSCGAAPPLLWFNILKKEEWFLFSSDPKKT